MASLLKKALRGAGESMSQIAAAKYTTLVEKEKTDAEHLFQMNLERFKDQLDRNAEVEKQGLMKQTEIAKIEAKGRVDAANKESGWVNAETLMPVSQGFWDERVSDEDKADKKKWIPATEAFTRKAELDVETQIAAQDKEFSIRAAQAFESYSGNLTKEQFIAKFVKEKRDAIGASYMTAAEINAAWKEINSEWDNKVTNTPDKADSIIAEGKAKGMDEDTTILAWKINRLRTLRAAMPDASQKATTEKIETGEKAISQRNQIEQLFYKKLQTMPISELIPKVIKQKELKNENQAINYLIKALPQRAEDIRAYINARKEERLNPKKSLGQEFIESIPGAKSYIKGRQEMKKSEEEYWNR